MATAMNGGEKKCSNLDGQAPESTDFANYFCTYGYIYHQKDMLEDHKRTGAYYNAVLQNRRQFAGKVVLDVGTGSGILALFAAMAGAKKVYAVEATTMAHNARKLVEHNKYGHVVEVIQGTIESISLPEQVDIIISEWMGYFLLRESMLDSVLVARDKFLKPGGALYPSHARLFLAPIRTQQQGQRAKDLQGSLEGWEGFLEDMKAYYGVDLGVLTPDYAAEQKDYYLATSAWSEVHPSQLVGSPGVFKTYDLHKLTLEELKAPLVSSCTMHISESGPVQAFCGYFDVDFKGSEQNPADNDIRLSTAPDATGATHWGQQCFFVNPVIEVTAGDSIRCELEVTRRSDNQRLLDVALVSHVDSVKGSSKRAMKYHID